MNSHINKACLEIRGQFQMEERIEDLKQELNQLTVLLKNSHPESTRFSELSLAWSEKTKELEQLNNKNYE